LLAVGALVLSACSEAGTDEQSEVSDSEPTSTSVSLATADVDQFVLEPLRPDFDDLPLGQFEDGACTFVEPRDLIGGNLILRGDVVDVSDRGEYPSFGGSTVGRVVEFDVSEILFDETESFSGVDRLQMVTSEEQIEDGYRYVGISFVADVDAGESNVLAVAYAYPDPTLDGVLIPRLAQAITHNGRSTVIHGNCSYASPMVDGVAEILGDASGVAMLERMVDRQAQGQTLVEFDRALAQYYEERDRANTNTSPP
jgi:hypothetical protein